MRRLLRVVGLIVLAAVPLPGQGAADRLLAKMTLEQKVGQLFMTWILSRAQGQEEARAELRELVTDVGLGGVVLSLGSARDASLLVADLQRRAAVPLLVAGDFEAGVAFRLTGATELGSNMLVGATGDSQLAREMGRVTAVEARALGFHWAFAPVVDVNVNPRNPIINVRSFGEDPALVARLGAAFVRGMEGANVLSTLKHFPGHGDVASDSHLELPTVTGDRARLDAVELRPFRAGIAAGTSAVMTGHLAVPGLGEDPGVAATLSKKILTGVLREQLGFDGLLVTDALDMGGVKGESPADAAVRALAAGADLLLMPPEPRKTRAALVEAVRRGVVSEQRLDDAVRRLLRAKERLGLLAGGGLVDPRWRRVFSTRGHSELASRIAARGVTLVRDERGLVPLPRVPRTVLLTLLDRADDPDGGRGARLHASLSHHGRNVVWHRLHPESEAADFERAVASLAEADVAVAALHVRVRSYSGVIGLPPALQPVARQLADVPRSVVVSFGNPYLIEELPGVSTYLCAYNDGPFTEAAVAAILNGEEPVLGRLPVSIPEVAARGEGLGFAPGVELGRASPDEEGLPYDFELQVRALLDRAIVDRVFPGAVAVVARRGKVVVEAAAGRESYAPNAPAVTPESVFDLASLTQGVRHRAGGVAVDGARRTRARSEGERTRAGVCGRRQGRRHGAPSDDAQLGPTGLPALVPRAARRRGYRRGSGAHRARECARRALRLQRSRPDLAHGLCGARRRRRLRNPREARGVRSAHDGECALCAHRFARSLQCRPRSAPGARGWCAARCTMRTPSRWAACRATRVCLRTPRMWPGSAWRSSAVVAGGCRRRWHGRRCGRPASWLAAAVGCAGTPIWTGEPLATPASPGPTSTVIRAPTCAWCCSPTESTRRASAAASAPCGRLSSNS